MFEKYMLLTRGFQNVVEDGKLIGFQIKIRITYYRGIYLPLIRGLNVTVDGNEYSPAQLRFSIGGRTYTIEELGREDKSRWPFGEAATLTILQPGGLKPGLHEVTLDEAIKPSYIPGNGFTAHVTRKVTLVA